MRTIPSRPGVTQSFLLVRPAAAPRAVVVLFAGGHGVVNVRARRLGLAGNFLVRNRARFAGHGLLVAVFDTPSDRADGLDGLRTTATHAADVRAVIEALRAEAVAPDGWWGRAWAPCRRPARPRAWPAPPAPTGSC